MTLHALLESDDAWHVVEVSERAPRVERRIELHCDDGLAVLAGGWDEHVVIQHCRTARSERIEAPGELPLLAELRAFVDHVAGGPPPKSSVDEGADDRAGDRRAEEPRALTDATILIPTHRHAALLPFAVRSALAQEGAEIDLFVVGDGVEDDTRRALEPFLADPRVRFFDRPKGERHGERFATRRSGIRPRRSSATCSDDDLLLPGHVRRGCELLEHADLVTDLPANVWPDGSIRYFAFDLARPEFVQLLAEGRAGGGLTGTSHTRDAYERLPFGWRPAPPDTPTDVYMLQQFLTLPGFSGATSERLTSLSFPSPLRTELTVDERIAELELWEGRIQDPRFPEELEALTFAAARRATERLKLTSLRLEAELEQIRRTRWWRLRRAVAELRPVTSAARQAALSSLSGPRARSRAEIIGSAHGQAMSSPGSSQRQPSSSAGSNSWLTA